MDKIMVYAVIKVTVADYPDLEKITGLRLDLLRVVIGEPPTPEPDEYVYVFSVGVAHDAIITVPSDPTARPIGPMDAVFFKAEDDVML